LFTTYELNAVAFKAQEAVRIPEGLNLDQEIVPGGGFGDLPDEDIESEEEDKTLDLGEGGGAGMEELRRVLREQEGTDKKKGRRKGKERKAEGEVMSPEEKAEKARARFIQVGTRSELTCYREKQPRKQKPRRIRIISMMRRMRTETTWTIYR
jgi:AP-3 complex subunit delta-1